MDQNQDAKPTQRAAVYIDGFNLYHPIREMEEPYLKWCNLWRLSELLCAPREHELRKVVFCTAMRMHEPASMARHQTFNNAQIASRVSVIKGHYIYNEEIGRYSEKQSDINVARSVIVDGFDDLYDCAYLLSADSDQAATARFFRERFPQKKLALVAPPNRKPSDKAAVYADLSFSLTKEQIEAAVFPAMVPGLDGGFIRRPVEYDPPEWWLHPDQRPKRRKR